MRIYHNQLSATLNKTMLPVWLVFGDEPWQKNDSINQIKLAAQQQGFNETIRLMADDKFDWAKLVDEYQSLSLFSSQRVIEVELVNGKISESGNKTLQAISENLYSDILLIIHGAKLDQAGQRKKWFKSLAPKSCFLPLYDIEGKQLQQWLYRQAQFHQLKLSTDLSQLMTELFEGNLLALDQELQKLALLFGQQEIQLDDAIEVLSKQAKFNPFNIIDAWLQGNVPRCIAMLDQQQQEGIAPAQLIWVIQKELQQLYKMKYKMAQGVSTNELFKEFRIWDKRKPLYQNALNNITLANINIATARLTQVDLISKTDSDFNAYLLLADVCTSLYHGDVTAPLSLTLV